MNELSELLDHYFSLGVAEGKEGRNHDTADGEAQATRDLIDMKIDRLSRMAERERDGWQPIETAPKDGSVFLAATTRAQRPTACMCKVESGKFLVLSNGEKFEGQGWAQWWPTHWQPLPPSPKPAAVSEGGEDE